MSVWLIIIAISANLSWYKMKGILKDNGIKVSYWYGHLNDIPNFYRLIQNEPNATLKSQYQRLFYFIIVQFILFIISAFYLLSQH